MDRADTFVWVEASVRRPSFDGDLKFPNPFALSFQFSRGTQRWFDDKSAIHHACETFDLPGRIMAANFLVRVQEKDGRH